MCGWVEPGGDAADECWQVWQGVPGFAFSGACIELGSSYLSAQLCAEFCRQSMWRSWKVTLLELTCLLKERELWLKCLVEAGPRAAVFVSSHADVIRFLLLRHSIRV